jgi:Glycosyl hydrolase family 63 N-terminal domain
MWASPLASEWWNLRHEASNSHGLQTFGWRHHDLRSFGEQVALDGPLNISTTFLKRPSSGYGGDWAISMHVALNERASEADYVNKVATLQPVYVYLGQEFQPDHTGPMELRDSQFEATSEWGSKVHPSPLPIPHVVVLLTEVHEAAQLQLLTAFLVWRRIGMEVY